MRKAIEAALITTREVTNHREGLIRWAGNSARLALRSGTRKIPSKGSSRRRIMPPD